jgi:sterol desaturase/sphingolipid hydroxylase (fatty acid hydroxylase superfamily)
MPASLAARLYKSMPCGASTKSMLLEKIIDSQHSRSAWDAAFMNGRLVLTYALIAAATYYAASFVQTLFHRLFGHTHRIKRIFQLHVKGHHAQYSGDMLSDRWIATERHITWYYAIPFTPMVVGAFLLLSIDAFIVHVAALAFAISLHVYLHRQYHLRRSWLNRFSWFRRKQRLHLIHHLRPQRNYAIVEYTWDRLLGTFTDLSSRIR